MKATLFLVLFSLSLVLAQPGGSPLASWAGSLAGVNTTWNYPDTVQGPNCVNSTSTNATYVSFAYTTNTTGVSQILVLGSGIYVYVYNSTLNTQNPCANAAALFSLENGAISEGPNYEDYFLFQAHVNYTFVVSASSSTAGDFAVAVYGATATGNNANGPTWEPITVSSSTPYACSQAGTSYNASFALFSWQQPTSGLFDITAGFALYTNFTNDYWGTYTYIALFHGNVTAATLTNSNNICTTLASSLIVANNEYARAAHQYGIQLNGGQLYTVVASGSQADNFANWGIFVAPSRLQPAISLPTGYVQPSGSVEFCSQSSSSNNQSYAVATVPAGPNNYVVLIAAAYESSYFGFSNWTLSDYTEAFVYNGSNNGTSTVAPQTCQSGAAYLVGLFYSSPNSLNVVPGQTYSIVASATYNSATPSAYLVYVLTGSPVGNVDTSVGTSGGLSTGTGSGTGGTGSGNGANIAGGTHTGTTNFTGSTTSASTTVACSFMFVVLAIMSLMF